MRPASARSVMGRAHTVNQDGWLVDPARGLFAVADGISARLAGEEASRLAMKSLPVLIERALGPSPVLGERAAQDAVREALQALSGHLQAWGERHPESRGLGTTLVMVLMSGAHAIVAHVGDSRCYRLRDGALAQLTRDHTLAATLEDLGEIGAETALSHPARSQLSRFIGQGEALDVDVMPLEVNPGDRFVLCSDGLSGALDEDQLRRLLLDAPDVDTATTSLVEAAVAGPGHDDITVVVVDA